MKRNSLKISAIAALAFFLCGCVQVVSSPGDGGSGIKVTLPQWYQDRQQKKDRQNMVNTLQEEKLQFNCVDEEDNHPQLDPQADTWFRQARLLEKASGPKDYEAIGTLYRKAIARDHYKAMRNLQNLLMDGLVKPLPGKNGTGRSGRNCRAYDQTQYPSRLLRYGLLSRIGLRGGTG
jgi:hypothetical protein